MGWRRQWGGWRACGAYRPVERGPAFPASVNIDHASRGGNRQGVRAGGRPARGTGSARIRPCGARTTPPTRRAPAECSTCSRRAPDPQFRSGARGAALEAALGALLRPLRAPVARASARSSQGDEHPAAARRVRRKIGARPVVCVHPKQRGQGYRRTLRAQGRAGVRARWERRGRLLQRREQADPPRAGAGRPARLPLREWDAAAPRRRGELQADPGGRSRRPGPAGRGGEVFFAHDLGAPDDPGAWMVRGPWVNAPFL